MTKGCTGCLPFPGGVLIVVVSQVHAGPPFCQSVDSKTTARRQELLTTSNLALRAVAAGPHTCYLQAVRSVSSLLIAQKAKRGQFLQSSRWREYKSILNLLDVPRGLLSSTDPAYTLGAAVEEKGSSAESTAGPRIPFVSSLPASCHASCWLTCARSNSTRIFSGILPEVSGIECESSDRHPHHDLL